MSQLADWGGAGCRKENEGAWGCVECEREEGEWRKKGSRYENEPGTLGSELGYRRRGTQHKYLMNCYGMGMSFREMDWKRVQLQLLTSWS